jgi:hypothetical protein
MIFLLSGSWDCKKTGIGRMMIMMSEEMLTTALVIIWLVSAEQFTTTPLAQIPDVIDGFLTVIRRNLPVVIERPAPSSKPQDLHDHESNDDISCHQLDQEILLQTQSKSC